MRRMGRLDNFGIRRVERLDGNVGYLDVRRVAVPANAGPAIGAAMELVAGTYALIIDLRHNGGGAPEGVVFWCSYLLDERPTHLNDIFHADTGETRQFWALPYVPGTRYPDRPVYVLTSGRTFSGGEDFGYTLQALGRATVVGETTGGGAHPTRGFPISAGGAHRDSVRALGQPGHRHELAGHRGGAGRRPRTRSGPTTWRTPGPSSTCWPWTTCRRRSRTRRARRWPGCALPAGLTRSTFAAGRAGR